MTIVQMLLGALVCSGLVLVAMWRMAAARLPRESASLPGAVQLVIGFVTNFFDTLGIGSFATTTAVFRLMKIVPDELIPGTMLIGHALPVVAQALIFTTVVEVNPGQMVILIACCVVGGWIGAGVVASVSRRTIQYAMAVALTAAAVLMLIGMFGLIPGGGTATTFPPRAFAIAIAVSVVLGALLTVGIGNYAPSLIIFSLLGMDPRAAFPIMMGSGAFVATIAGVRFIRGARFDNRAALGLALGGIPGVLVAAWLVRSLPLEALRWLVLVVVLYTAVSLLRSAKLGSGRES
ncbi:MAG TPA: sulfite exporter TauE/SafE family protein [Vicinamibacterales bacterium]|nr:sulfite exporter TauE/SafE family protein [Vicinamibacterales bacterium]